MTSFTYRVVDPEGVKQSGTLEAPDAAAAAQQLASRNLWIIHLAPASGWSRRVRAPKTLRQTDLMIITQQLSTLIGAGQPLEKSLGILVRQAKEGRKRALLERVHKSILGGKTFFQALDDEQPNFSPFYTSMVQAGESSGALDVTLGQLSDYLERSDKLRNEVLNALIYPAFLVAGVVGAVVLLLAYVIPQFVPIFSDLGVALPWITEVILALGQFASDSGLLVAMGVAASIWLDALSLRSPARRLSRDRWLLRMALLGPLIQRVETARLARTLGTLLCNGVALLPALLIARNINANQAVRVHIEEVTEGVKGGSSLADALAADSIVPELAVQMIEVGEQSGKLGVLLIKVADTFDIEAKRVIDRMLAALVPALTVVMAVLVAVIMLAIMLPLMSLTSNI
jgi:general secretion pathway protein F